MENELEVVNIRLVKEPSLYSEKILDSPQAVVELMAKELAQYDREVFCVLNMKNNGQVINMNMVSVGSINASLVIPREVFKSSILANASAIIGLHNHPSGNVEPSKEDISHIIYVNSQIKDESALGKLMHDFYCTNPKDMNYKILAERVRYFKEDEKGVATMCRVMEDMRNETAREERIAMAQRLLKLGKLSYEEIAETAVLTVEEVKALDEKVIA